MTFTKIFFSVIILYVAVTTIYYWINDESWSIYSIKLRKTLYLIFFGGIGSGIVLGYISYTKWSELVQFITIATVIDISIFQTPNITKFANTEFKHNELIEKALNESTKEFKMIGNKENLLLQIIQDTEQNLKTKPAITSFNEYSSELKQYLNKYIDFYDIKVRVYQFKRVHLEDEVKQDLVDKIEAMNITYNTGLSNGEINELSEGLFIAKMQQLSAEVFVLPIFGKNYNVLICVNGENVFPTDLAHITYMTYFFEWYMV